MFWRENDWILLIKPDFFQGHWFVLVSWQAEAEGFFPEEMEKREEKKRFVLLVWVKRKSWVSWLVGWLVGWVISFFFPDLSLVFFVELGLELVSVGTEW